MAGFSIDPLALITDIEVKSNYTPQFDFNPNAPSPPSHLPADVSKAMKAAQVAMTFHFHPDLGMAPITIAPWGNPGPSKWGSIKLGGTVMAVGGLGLTAYGLLSLFLPKKK